MTTIWTIGYEGKSQQDVVGQLYGAEIGLLVDVRLRPQSRKPGLSKTTLGNGLADAGIRYEHRRPLGTPLEIRGLFRAKQYEEARTAYREHLLDAAVEDLEWLAQQAVEQRVAMLCFELKPDECHRRVIAEELVRMHGVDVVDL